MESQDLFAVGRRKKRAPRPKSPHAKRIQEIMLRVYFPLYQGLIREKPDITPREWGVLRLLVDEYGPDVVERRLRMFMAMADPWVRDHGYSMGIFRSQWKKLAAQDQTVNQPQTTGGRPQGTCLHQPPCQGGPNGIVHSRKIVEEMKGRPSTPQTPSASSPTTSKLSDPF